MSMWWTIVVASVGTYLIRGSFLWLHGRIAIPPAIECGLRYVPPAVLAALTVPAVVTPRGTVDLAAPELLAGAIAAVVAWRTRSITATLVVGLAALWTTAWLYRTAGIGS